MKPPKIQRPTDNFQAVARIGYGIIALTFVGLLGWAAFAPLDSAVIANGVVSAEGNRKTVQHLEGGMLAKILVREGEKVKAGQVLFELDPTQANAAAGITRNQYVALKAMEARLLAERDQRPSISFPADLTRLRADPMVARAIADEQAQFTERRQTIQGQVDLMNAQRLQYQSEIEGIDRQTQGLKDQLGFIEDELIDLRKLYDKGLVPRPRLLALEREQASLSGSIGRLTADRSKAVQGASDTQLKVRQIKQEFFEQVSQSITETRVRLAEVTEKEVVASDAQKRIKIVSPVNGTAQNLRFFTEGAVVRAAEPLVDIAPEDEAFVIQAHFQPTDVDNVHMGMVTEVRLPAFHSREIPILNGTIQSLSQDRISDPQNKLDYFLGIVRVDVKQLPPHLRGRVTAGMPAQVIVPTGERTVLQYLFSPLRDTLRTTMREE
ncbi:HlyD family type I secretion periplasmic adaptor subunit [Caulobacter vibrioides]|uniref:Membrane fusion protein (MFP) family protein n=1 Tax=Caulobacter vibrioides TaxID=155892 RepID=Q9RMM9_CAUVI|nr:HlyD family type I secretion periplasmic adaptor subunit [Caulobacter vibrioides]AAF07963.1 membrane forming unit [Caulobacter vibrioides]ATC23961.2 HlyD family type I secretion periplasmic adaptor subunit [Caulobacter vibrioides]AZH12204.1 HlyD family type I secretion periplasmic adaptor subunit [Caulobacter vibrioides]